MYYLNTNHLETVGRNWIELAGVIEQAIQSLGSEDFAQPVKPYLRYRNLNNRIIAMPAFVGGAVNYSGIKWIASFPDNLKNGIKRAHSVSILNEADTGIPVCAINTTLISGIRTAAVTALMLKKYLEIRPDLSGLTVGMTGFGPIGQLHLEMAGALLGERLKAFKIYDLRPVDLAAIPVHLAPKVSVSNTFEEAFRDVDVFITATVSAKPYINSKPKPGSLHLNVSLRDYEAAFMHEVDVIIVDDWEEVCREKTDIEMMHLNEGLQKEQTLNLVDVFCKGALDTAKPDDVLMFNPMGMAVFDVAVGAFYYRQAVANGIGVLLED